MMHRNGLVILLAATIGCGSTTSEDAGVSTDAGATSKNDGSVQDASSLDASIPDTSFVDASSRSEACVSNTNREVLGFDLSDTRNSPPTWRLGNQTQLRGPTGIALDLVHDELFVASTGRERLLVFARTARGNVAPIRVLEVETGVNWAGVDASQDELYLALTPADSVQVYSRTAEGSATAIREIRAAAGTKIRAVAVDEAHHELVTIEGRNNGPFSIVVHPATGASRTLALPVGAPTPNAVAVDPVHDEIVVYFSGAGGASIQTFSRTAVGNTAPLRSMTGPELNFYTPVAMLIDPVHDHIYVAEGVGAISAMIVLPRTGTGVVDILRKLKPDPADTSFPADSLGMALDLTHDELFFTSPASDAIWVVARTAEEAAPTLRGIAALFGGTAGPDIASDRGRIFMANQEAGTLSQFSVDARDGDGPLQEIKRSPDVFRPMDIALGPEHLFVLNGTDPLVQLEVYPRSASGEVTPDLEVSFDPWFASRLAFDAEHDEIIVALAASSTAAPYSQAVGTYSASGQPLRLLKSASTEAIRAIAADSGELFILTDSTLNVYARSATAEDPPIRSLGPLVRGNADLAVNGDEIHLLNISGRGILTYDRAATGAALPKRTIVGQTPDFDGFLRITLCR